MLRTAEGEELTTKAVAALSAVQLYGAAGSLVLQRSRCHPALHSAAAQLSALKAYVRQQHDSCADGGLLKELHDMLAVSCA